MNQNLSEKDISGHLKKRKKVSEECDVISSYFFCVFQDHEKHEFQRQSVISITFVHSLQSSYYRLGIYIFYFEYRPDISLFTNRIILLVDILAKEQC